jgi:hypothetical protein
MWAIRPQIDCLYVAVFNPKRKKKLYKEARNFLGQELYVTPLNEVEGPGVPKQWAFRAKEMSLLVLEQDLDYVREITEPIEEVEETTLN